MDLDADGEVRMHGFISVYVCSTKCCIALLTFLYVVENILSQFFNFSLRVSHKEISLSKFRN